MHVAKQQYGGERQRGGDKGEREKERETVDQEGGRGIGDKRTFLKRCTKSLALCLLHMPNFMLSAPHLYGPAKL